MAMDDELFDELQSNLKEAVRYAKGKTGRKPAYVVLTAADIKAIREQIQMSQAVFARTFRLSVETVKGWEQGKRKPDAAATNYLLLIKADANDVRQKLAA